MPTDCRASGCAVLVLHLYFSSVFKCEAYVVFRVNRHVVKQVEPEVICEFCHAGRQRFDFSEEGFNDNAGHAVRNGYDDCYYPGVTFSLHEMLYDNLFLLMLFELALIACFMTAYLMKYEEFYDTHQNVYATKVGRGIVFSKAAASVTASALAAVIVITVSVACLLIVLPQSWSFLQTSVSAAMATERRGMVQYPFITWERMSQLHYLLRTCAVTVGYTVTASLVTFVLSFVSKNAYIDAVLTAMLYFALYVAAAVLSGNNLFGFVWQFTPTVGMLNVPNWFMEYVFTPYASYPGYAEGVCVGFSFERIS